MRKPVYNAAHKKAGILSFEHWDASQGTMLCLVDPNKIIADPRFQRPLDTRYSALLAKKNLALVPYPICGYTDGVVDAIDGQHRVDVQKQQGKTKITVVVKFNMTLEEKAALYHSLNHAKRPNKWNVFKANLTAGHEDYVQMHRIARNYGFSLKCDDPKADLRNTDPMIEAMKYGIYEQWIMLLSAFKTGAGKLHPKASTCATDFQRGIIDFIRMHPRNATSRQVFNMLKGIGVDEIRYYAENIARDTRSAGRNHYKIAFIRCLEVNNIRAA